MTCNPHFLFSLSLALITPFAAQAQTVPDLSGLWLSPFGYGIPNEDGTPFRGRPPSPVDMPPIKPWALAEHQQQVQWAKEGMLDQLKFAGTAQRCLPFGTPADMYQPYPLQIIQTEDAFIILFEANHQSRIVHMSAEMPVDLEPSYKGYSIGRFVGDTLVIETAGHNDKTWLLSAGGHEGDRLASFPHTEQLQVTEWLSLTDGGKTLVYRARIDDPGAYDEPWGFETTYNLRNDLRLSEYACAENNIDAAMSASD